MVQSPQWFNKLDDGSYEIRCDFIYPPIPSRAFDWCATYDGDEPDDDGNMLAGYGKTPAEAVRELEAALIDAI